MTLTGHPFLSFTGNAKMNDKFSFLSILEIAKLKRRMLSHSDTVLVNNTDFSSLTGSQVKSINQVIDSLELQLKYQRPPSIMDIEMNLLGSSRLYK